MNDRYKREASIAIWKVKDAELDLLIDENSKFLFNASGKRILVDKDCPFSMAFKIRPRNTYVEVSVSYQDDGKRREKAISRFMLGIVNPNILVDHHNQNPLDNRKKNIRICSKSQNQANKRKISKLNVYKGYTVTKSGITVMCQKNGIETRYKLLSKDEEYAAIVYDCLAVINHGQFADTNFKTLNYTAEYIESILEPIKHQKNIRDTQRRNINKDSEDVTISDVNHLRIIYDRLIDYGDSETDWHMVKLKDIVLSADDRLLRLKELAYRFL